ncbi:MAG: hypothetical protein LBC97_14265 [Bifidobacteriaceae bacterium]|jgi:hypothetical protein|nr:hypothetical protein [Bifidobacteriaceae bacterium]
METVILRLVPMDELAEELSELAVFLGRLRRAYRHADVEFAVTGQVDGLPESEPGDPNHVAEPPGQWLFLFGTELSRQAKDEYLAAQAACESAAWDRDWVAAWFKDLEPGQEMTPELAEFRAQIENDRHHRSYSWATLEDVKLGLAVKFNGYCSGYLWLAARDGKAVTYGETLVDLPKTRQYAEFEGLGDLRRQIAAVDGQLTDAELAKIPRAAGEMERINAEHDRLAERIHQAENEFLELMENVMDNLSPALSVTPRNLEGCRRFQAGDVAGALEALSFAGLKADVEAAERVLKVAEWQELDAEGLAGELTPPTPEDLELFLAHAAAPADSDEETPAEAAREHLQRILHSFWMRAEILQSRLPNAEARREIVETLREGMAVERRHGLESGSSGRLSCFFETHGLPGEADGFRGEILASDPSEVDLDQRVRALMSRTNTLLCGSQGDEAEEALRELREFALGEEDLELATALLGQTMESWMHRGRMEEASGDLTAMAERFKPLVEADPAAYGPVMRGILEGALALLEVEKAWTAAQEAAAEPISFHGWLNESPFKTHGLTAVIAALHARSAVSPDDATDD